MSDTKEAKAPTIRRGQFYFITGYPFYFSKEAQTWLKSHARGEREEKLLETLRNQRRDWQLGYLYDEHDARTSLLLIRCLLELRMRAIDFSRLSETDRLHIHVQCIDMQWKSFTEIDMHRGDPRLGDYENTIRGENAVAYFDGDAFFEHALDRAIATKRPVDAQELKDVFRESRRPKCSDVLGIEMTHQLSKYGEEEMRAIIRVKAPEGEEHHWLELDYPGDDHAWQRVASRKIAGSTVAEVAKREGWERSH